MNTLEPAITLQIIPGRGAHEIGGSFIRLRPSQGLELLLDAGLPLFEAPGLESSESDAWRLGQDPLADLARLRAKGLVPAPGLGLFQDEAGPCRIGGILLSHPHPDHWGLLSLVKPGICAWAHPQALAYLRAMAAWKGTKLPALDWHELAPGESCEVAGFQVRAHAVSHSAWGCLAFDITAPGAQRVVYTGDYRGQAGGLPVMAEVAPGADLVITETTLLGGDAARAERGEDELAAWMAEDLKAAPGLVSVAFSGGHAERLRTLRQACALAGRELVLDLYTACILAQVEGEAALQGLRVLWTAGYIAGAKAALGEQRLQALLGGGREVKAWQLQAQPTRYLLSLRTDTVKHTLKYRRKGYPGQMPRILRHLHSLWQGYRLKDQDSPVERFLKDEGAQVEDRLAHVSGHASPRAIQALLLRLQPKAILGVHGFEPERLKDLLPGVAVLDGDPVLPGPAGLSGAAAIRN